MNTQPKLKSARHGARVAVVQGLYQHEQTDNHSALIAREFIEHYIDSNEIFVDSSAPDQAYFQKLMEGIPHKLAELDNEIQKYLQDKWKIDRLPAVMRSLLRCASYELMFEPLVPTPVVINEYIEVARAFLDERDVKFVNGILDNIAKAVRPA